MIHNNYDDSLLYRKLPSGNAGLEPEPNRAFTTIAYDTKQWTIIIIVNQVYWLWFVDTVFALLAAGLIKPGSQSDTT